MRALSLTAQAQAVAAPSAAGSSSSSALGARASQALSLHLQALWQRHATKVYVIGGLTAVYVVWKALFRTASAVLDISESVAGEGPRRQADSRQQSTAQHSTDI